MGNYVPCTLSGPGGKQSSRCAKVIFQGGDVRHFSTPTKAAELMLETPNSFLVNSRSLKIGRRFSAISADEDLEMANVYVAFPMQRLNSMVTAADMDAVFFSTKRVSGGKGRISPEMSPEMSPKLVSGDENKLKLDEIEGYSTVEIKRRLSMTRSRKPLLETIAEEPDDIHGRLRRRLSHHF